MPRTFGKLLGGMLTLIGEVEGEYAGFGSLKDNDTIEMLYVHPFHAGEGVGTAICEALERLAAGRGAKEIDRRGQRDGGDVLRGPRLQVARAATRFRSTTSGSSTRR